jgi:hypothetical protein
MDAIVQQFLSTGTLVLACAVFIATFFVRRVVETAVPSLAKKADENEAGVTYETTFARWWNQVILYAIPVTLGALSGLMNIPFVFGESIETIVGRCLYGFVVGWFSSFFYKVGRKVLVKNVGVEDPGDTLPE